MARGQAETFARGVTHVVGAGGGEAAARAIGQARSFFTARGAIVLRHGREGARAFGGAARGQNIARGRRVAGGAADDLFEIAQQFGAPMGGGLEGARRLSGFAFAGAGHAPKRRHSRVTVNAGTPGAIWRSPLAAWAIPLWREGRYKGAIVSPGLRI